VYKFFTLASDSAMLYGTSYMAWFILEAQLHHVTHNIPHAAGGSSPDVSACHAPTFTPFLLNSSNGVTQSGTAHEFCKRRHPEWLCS